MASARDPGLRVDLRRLREQAEEVSNAFDAGMPEEGSDALAALMTGLEEAERKASIAPAPSLEAPLVVAKDAEEKVLAACLAGAGGENGNAAVRDLRPLLGETGSMFYFVQHRQIYEAIIKADLNGGSDALNVSEHLRKDGTLEELGGKERLDELEQLAPPPYALKANALIVRRHSLERDLQIAVTSEPRDHGRIEEAASALTREQISGDPRRALDGNDWLDAQVEGCPSVWGRGDTVLWAEGEPLMLYGPDGVGKTSVAQQVVLGLCEVRREPLFKLPIIKADRPVLYLACDRPKQARRSMYRMIPREERDALKGRLLVWEGPLPFAIHVNPRSLYDFCVLHGAGYLIVDSLKDVAVDLTKPEIALRINQAFQWLSANGIEVLILHHPRKDPAGVPAKPKSLEDVYGDRNFVSGMGSVILLWGKAGDPVVQLLHLKQPADEFGPVQLLHDHDAGVTELYRHKTISEILAGAHGPLTVNSVATEVYGPEATDSEKEKMRRQLRKLCKDGEAEELTDPTSGTKTYLPRG